MKNTDAVTPQFYILEDHLKWYKSQECKIWETFSQTIKKVCEITENAKFRNTQSGFHCLW